MSTPVNTAIAAITENLRTLAGVGPIADYPTEQTGAPWPRVFVYAQNGGWFIYSHAGANGKPTAITIQTMRIRVIVNRSDLPKDFELLMPYADRVPLALLSGYVTDKFNGSIMTFGDARSPGSNAGIECSGPVADQYGDTQTVELQFSFNCSITMAIP